MCFPITAIQEFLLFFLIAAREKKSFSTVLVGKFTLLVLDTSPWHHLLFGQSQLFCYWPDFEVGVVMLKSKLSHSVCAAPRSSRSGRGRLDCLAFSKTFRGSSGRLPQFPQCLSGVMFVVLGEWSRVLDFFKWNTIINIITITTADHPLEINIASFTHLKDPHNGNFPELWRTNSTRQVFFYFNARSKCKDV